MRSLERHHGVGAYALGVLDEADAFRFEDHLTKCLGCTTQVSEFRPAVRQLMLYRRVTQGPVAALAVPGPELLERLLDEVSTSRRSGLGRRLSAVAAAVVLAVGGTTLAAVFVHGSSGAARAISGRDPATGVWARIAAQDRVWGSQVDMTVGDRSGPHSCRLIAVGKDGSEQTMMSWMVAADDHGTTAAQGGTALRSAEIDHYEVRTRDGRHLVTLKSR